MSQFSVMAGRYLVRFCDAETNDKHEFVAPFLRAVLV